MDDDEEEAENMALESNSPTPQYYKRRKLHHKIGMLILSESPKS